MDADRFEKPPVDILRRLADWAMFNPQLHRFAHDMQEAADEIKRLRAEVASLTAEADARIADVVDGRRDRLVAAGSAMERLLKAPTMSSAVSQAIECWREAVRS